LGDVGLGPALPALVPVDQRRPLFIQFGALRLGEKLLVRIRCKGVSNSSVQMQQF
jgi:hypothetical protein